MNKPLCSCESNKKVNLTGLFQSVQRSCLSFDRITVRVNCDGSVTSRIKIFAPCSSPAARILNREDVSLLWQFQNKQKKKYRKLDYSS